MTKRNLTPLDPSPEMVSMAKYLSSLPPEEIAVFCMLEKEFMLKRSRMPSEGKQDRRDRFRYHARSFEVLAEALQTTAAMPRE